MNEDDLVAQIRAKLDTLNTGERRLAQLRLDRILRRKRALAMYPSPGHLAKLLAPDTIQTKMMTALDQIAIAADAGFQRQWIISTPPQEGKTMRMGTAVPLWLLMRNPQRRIIIASYEQTLAARSTLAVRQAIETFGAGYKGDRNYANQEDQLGLILDPDQAKQANWNLIDGPGRRNGGMVAVGVGGSLTGRSADVMIIDDAVKNAQQADNPVQRQAVWDWYQSVASTRLSPGAIVIVIGCLTGDALVRMADGSERPIREIRPGDLVASYEDGRMTTARVLNWINHGPDSLFRIRMKSGTEIRANARHPFLTVENGERVWRRTDELQPSARILRVAEPTLELPAPPTDVTLQQSARACACRTTARPAGQQGTGHPRSTLDPGARLTSATATRSTTRLTTACSVSRVAVVPFAENRPALPTPEDVARSSLTTTTTPEPCAVCCATNATWPLGTAELLPDFEQQPTTWTLDEVVEVAPTLAEDVFDIQVERTENFIANGLVTHNTRWHEDDLIGRIIKDDLAGGGVPAFQQLVIPAIAKSRDPLGRKPGQYLVSTRKRTVREWKAIRKRVGERFWSAMYMGEPHPPAGGIFQLEWIENHRRPVAPELSVVEVFVDPADNEGDGDEAGVITMGRGAEDQHLYVLADDSGHMTSGRWFRVAFLAALRHNASAVRYEKSLSGLRRIGRKAWKDLLREAKKLHELDPYKGSEFRRRPEQPDGELIFAAATELARDDAESKEIVQLQRDLTELWPLVPQVLALPPTGIPIQAITAKGTKTHRAKMTGPMHEWGHVHWVGDFVELKYQLVAWQESQDSPDRMDAYVHGITKLGQTGDALMEPPRPPTRGGAQLPSRPSVTAPVLERQGVTRSGLGAAAGRYG